LPLAQENMTASESEPEPLSGIQRWQRRAVGLLLFICFVVATPFVAFAVWLFFHLQYEYTASHLEFLGARVGTEKSNVTIWVPPDQNMAVFLKKVAGDLRRLARWNRVDLDLCHSNVTDIDLRRLGILRSLFALRVAGTGITDKTLEELDGSTNIDGLDLDGTKVTDAGLAHLANSPQLWHLSFAHTAITDVGLKHLKGLAKLMSLDLRGTQVTAEGVVELRRSLRCPIKR
jgi:hypothetical protein